MTSFSFTYFIRTPSGREPVTDGIIEQPLLLDAGEPHPTLTVADYFQSLAQFVQSSAEVLPLPSMADNQMDPLHCEICSEKLGAFYHVARIKASASGQGEPAFAVNTAISEAGRRCLRQDHELLGRFLPEPMRPLVPAVYTCSDIKDENGRSSPSPFIHLAVEWLDDFHEWHLCSDGGGARRFGLWSDHGVQYLREEEARQLFRRIAHIVSLSYDWHNGSFLQQWHHAAGDFIVKRETNGSVKVRLITVRSLRPFPFLSCQTEQERYLSTLLFLVDLSIRTRLDKLDGVGETVWLDDFVVEETVNGFLTALAERKKPIGEAYDSLIGLIANLSLEDLHTLSTSLLASYRDELPATELEQVENNFDSHLHSLTFWLAEAEGRKRETRHSKTSDEIY